MESTVTIDLRQVGRGLEIPLRQIQTTVELLDEGNTVPFITRYRKDQTGGLDEEQIREIQGRLAKLRLLADRKQTILRSIESQGKLTERLSKQILAATTSKRLEDLYLPFKPKKQTLATLARSRGLEPLAREILEAAPTCADLDARAADFISTDKHVPTAADALLGAGHILAEQISEQAELRGRLREVLQRTGVLVSSRLPVEEKPQREREPKPAADAAVEPPVSEETPPAFEAVFETPEETPEEATAVELDAVEVSAEEVPPPETLTAETPSLEAEMPAPETLTAETPLLEASMPQVATPPANDFEFGLDLASLMSQAMSSDEPPPESAAEPTPALIPHSGSDNPTIDASAASFVVSAESTPVPSEVPAAPPENAAAARPSAAAQRKLARQQAKAAMQKKRELKKKKIEEKKIKDFQDYFDFHDDIKKIPPHRVLAINRGERARVLRVRIESDLQAMTAALEEMLVPPEHPHADYLRGCARDALSRLILPSLEREVRRELTDHAEAHAVGVFAKNLRNLFLQPPVHNHRLLAVDPGFRSGCKLAALDEFGNLLGQGAIYLVGKPDRSGEARQKVLEMIEKHQLTVVVIGNGTACRHTENFFADLIENQLKDKGVAYVIVNEAGASVYSTSRVGREEFPQYDATLRGAISIGRRLQDPLSELVKIDPANIGVGLYQHDVKAKHLRTSLDDVVESCVNFVGVDVNTASPALLRYVSGLNQLTARRLYEHRREHGPFHSREQLRQVPGFGEATFVQAAGFLKILGGDNPLDATWIHPESYLAANEALGRLGGSAADLREKQSAAALAERIGQVDRASLAHELSVGLLTLNDILTQLVRPGRDPREDLPAPVFKRGVIKLEDLAAGMELTGTVLNVVDFGCFVDIGMHDSGLVHVSRLADKYVRDPHDVVAVGDVVKVWVVEIDKERRRVSLTMVRPGSERPKYPPRGPKSAGGRSSGTQPTGEGDSVEGENRTQQRPPRSGGQQRPPRPAGQQGGARPPRSEGQRPPRAEGQRPPRSGGEGRPPRSEGRGRPRGEQRRPLPQPRPTPKPVIPLTDAMKTGKEPLRTFSDLMQFYQHQTVEPSDNKPPAAEPAPAEAAAVRETPAVASEPLGDQATASEAVVPEPVVIEAACEPFASEPLAQEPPASDPPLADEHAPAEKREAAG
ncbi:MAG: Tex-like N-terminal domain-containing protein [Thermoguttaceae bacterium]